MPSPRPTHLVTAFVLLLAVPGARLHRAVVPWHPSGEDDGPSSGPDAGSCEATRTCGAPVK